MFVGVVAGAVVASIAARISAFNKKLQDFNDVWGTDLFIETFSDDISSSLTPEQHADFILRGLHLPNMTYSIK